VAFVCRFSGVDLDRQGGKIWIFRIEIAHFVEGETRVGKLTAVDGEPRGIHPPFNAPLPSARFELHQPFARYQGTGGWFRSRGHFCRAIRWLPTLCLRREWGGRSEDPLAKDLGGEVLAVDR
jgi:hypothetical protein